MQQEKSWRFGFRSSCSSSVGLSIVLRIVIIPLLRSLTRPAHSSIVLFVSLGLMYGAPSTIGRLWINQSAALLGNLVGGAIFIGLAAHLLNHWKSPLFNNARGTLLGQDMDSTRRARETEDGKGGK